MATAKGFLLYQPVSPTKELRYEASTIHEPVNREPLADESLDRSTNGALELDNRLTGAGNPPVDRSTWFAGVMVGAILVAGGIYLQLEYPMPGISSTALFPFFMIAGGMIWFALGLLIQPRTISKVTITDAVVRIRYARGRVADFRWAAPNLRLNLTRVVQDSSGQRLPHEDWAVKCGWVIGAVSAGIGDGLLERARRLGLVTSSTELKVRLHYSSRFEIWQFCKISRPGSSASLGFRQGYSDRCKGVAIQWVF